MSPLTVKYECPQLFLFIITSGGVYKGQGRNQHELTTQCLHVTWCFAAYAWNQTQEKSQWIVAQGLLSSLTIPGFM